MTPRDRVALILASTSPYRRALLARVVPRFEQVAPGIDEAPLGDETASGLAARLAQAKAVAAAADRRDAVVIGSDQAAEVGGVLLGKPGDAAAAIAQLTRESGNTVVFHTAVCVVDARAGAPRLLHAADVTRVRFRSLAADEIRRYVEHERPFDCAGSFKAEGLGIALFEAIESDDPTALIGLPLIAVCRLLRQAGVTII